MTLSIDLAETSPHLTELVSYIRAGEEVVFIENGDELARLVPSQFSAKQKVAHPTPPTLADALKDKIGTICLNIPPGIRQNTSENFTDMVIEKHNNLQQNLPENK
jgi:antitoxin (DNA-binding transcriptional repressor) of toxin-antitoxin stability system